MAELTETTWRARATLRCYTCSPDRGDGICFLSGFPRVQRRLGDHQNGEAAAASESCEKPYLVESSDDVTGVRLFVDSDTRYVQQRRPCIFTCGPVIPA